MSGFMSGPLGFSSTIGAAIGGAARQANEMFAESRAQARQDEIMKDAVWANKFDNAQQQEREETKNRRNEANIFSTLKNKAGGDERVAFDAMNKWRMNPKQDLDALFNSVENTVKGPGYTADTNYTSPFASNQADDAAAGQARLQGLYGRLSPKYQQMVNPPNGTSVQPLGSEAAPATNTAPATSSYSGLSAGNALSKDPQTRAMLDDPKHWESVAVQNAARAKYGLSPMPEGLMTRDKADASDISKYRAQHAIDNEKVDADIRKQFATTNAKDYLTELYNRKKNVDSGNVGEIYNDSNDFIRMLEDGHIKTNAAQPIVDGVNRLLSSVNVDILEKAGISNHVNDSNEAGKILGRLMFGQIPNYHLGRWTDREFATLRQIIPDMGKDPNTNLKIALLLRAGAERSMSSTREELSAIGNDAANPNLSAAMQTSQQYMSKAQDMPWITINRNSSDPKQADAYNKLPVGGYWEDLQTGILHKKS